MALRWWILLLLFVGIVVGTTALIFFPTPARAPSSDDKSNLIRVDIPVLNSFVHSPITVSGTARGYWFFEAILPVEIRDNNGVVLGVGIAQAQEEWMTEDFVPFKAAVTFATSTTRDGVVVFKKDNPSGLPEHDDELVIPVVFE